MIFLGPKIIKGSPEKLLSYYFIEFFNFLHWPKSGPDKFIILESLLIYRVLIQRVSSVINILLLIKYLLWTVCNSKVIVNRVKEGSLILEGLFLCKL